MPKNLLLLAGDGIGPEIMSEVKKIINWLNVNKKLDLKITEELAGGVSYDQNKTPLTDDVLYKAMDSDAVLLGAVGGPKYDQLEFSKRLLENQLLTSLKVGLKLKGRHLYYRNFQDCPSTPGFRGWLTQTRSLSNENYRIAV